MTNPRARGDSAAEIVHFLENCKDFCHAVLLVCPHSPVCCNPTPKKGLLSLGICVPWCPRVNRGCSKPIKCCFGVPSPPNCQPVFALSKPLTFAGETGRRFGTALAPQTLGLQQNHHRFGLPTGFSHLSRQYHCDISLKYNTN